jgi:hypothetical protein
LTRAGARLHHTRAKARICRRKCGASALTDLCPTLIKPDRMRLYSGKIPVIGTELVRSLVEAGDIAVTDKAEAELDVQAVLKEYLRLEREITERAKDMLQKRNLPYEQFGKVKRALAGEKGFGLGDDGLDWITNQLIESFMQSSHVEEIFAEDSVLRKKMADILKRHMMVEEEIDAEVRKRIKNLEEGTATWEVEYAKAVDQIKRNRGLE